MITKIKQDGPDKNWQDGDYKNKNSKLLELKKTKTLKDSQKYKKVFINRDLTVTQIIRLKHVIKRRNDENLK